MPGKDVLPSLNQISPSERDGIMAKINKLGPLDLDIPVASEAVRSRQPSAVAGTASTGETVISHLAPGKSSPSLSKVGNEICVSCEGKTAHACVSCLYPCHNPVNSWRDSFGQEQRCSIPDKGGQEGDILCRLCANLPPAEPRRQEDTTPFDDLDNGVNVDNVQSDEAFQATQVWVPPSTPPLQPQVSDVPLAPASSSDQRAGDALPAPYQLTVRLDCSNQALRNVRAKDISFGEMQLTGDLIDLLPRIVQDGIEKKTLIAERNRTYDNPGGVAQKIHTFVPFAALDEKWGLFDALTSLGEQMGTAWCNAFGYKAGTKVCVPCYMDPAAGYGQEGLIPGWLILREFNPDHMTRPKKCPHISFAPWHMDGIRGLNVYTITIPLVDTLPTIVLPRIAETDFCSLLVGSKKAVR